MSFDAIAPWYRTLETIAFGSVLQRARVACLEEIDPPGRALIVGEGNGRFLGELIRTYPGVAVDCVDASRRMLNLARKQVGPNASRVRFLQHDIASSTPRPGRYDLIVTHFFLDCFRAPEVGNVVAKLAQGTAANSIWLLADFRIPNSGVARIHARAWLAVMYAFFRGVAGIDGDELVDPSPFLRAEGFALERQYLFRSGMLKSELWRRTT